MRKVIEFLNFIQPLSEELKIYLYDSLRTETLPKKSRLLRPGSICERIYFVEKGLFRCFIRKKDEEICKWFMKEGDVVISVNSFFNQVPSTETIESIEACEIHSITFAQLQELYRRHPEFRSIGQKLTEIYYCRSEVRADNLIIKSTDERYNDLLRDQPDLAKRVPGKYLASHLGMSFQTFSRIKLSHKKGKWSKDII
jgi:CRP-like cAMP-binding protein